MATELQCPNITIEGKVGDRVILPCSTKDKKDISRDQVEWFFKDPTTGENEDVLTYLRGKNLPGEKYKNRARFFGNTSSGNCSLSLVVAKFDSGTYHGFVLDHVCCPVTLKVHPEENTDLYDPLNPNMLQCPKKVEGKDGDTVILPCSTKDKTDISREEVQWSFKDPTTGEDKTVHTYFQGEDFLHEQRDDFKDRTSLFKDRLSSGNCSLRLLVTTSHSGKYRGCVGGHRCCTVTLKVLPEGEDDTSQKHQDDTNPNNGPTHSQIVGITVPLLLIVIIAYVAYRYREQLKNFCFTIWSRMKTIYQGVPVEAQQPPQNQENKPEDQNPNEEQDPMLGNENQDHLADATNRQLTTEAEIRPSAEN